MTVEEAIKTLKENGYVTDLLYNPLDVETEILTAAQEDGINLPNEKLKELSTILLQNFRWGYYRQEINNDLEREAAKVVTDSYEVSWFDNQREDI